MKTPLFSMRGFTLVELLVTMAIFISVITIATGALFSTQVVNARLEQTQAILDGMNLATEVIVRDIRYGSLFYCDNAIPTPIITSRRECPYPVRGTVLVFRPTIGLSGTTDQTKDRVAYYVSGGILYKNEYPFGATMRTKQITSADVNIQMLSFYSVGVNSSTESSSDFEQPLITLIISGVTVPKKKNIQPVTFNLQTTGVSRTLDN